MVNALAIGVAVSLGVVMLTVTACHIGMWWAHRKDRPYRDVLAEIRREEKT